LIEGLQRKELVEFFFFELAAQLLNFLCGEHLIRYTKLSTRSTTLYRRPSTMPAASATVATSAGLLL
jgi:hypothetical protein